MGKTAFHNARERGNKEIQSENVVVFQNNMSDNRARYIATAIQALILGAVTYYGVKWLVDALDPTKKSRLAAQKQVIIISRHAYIHTYILYLISRLGKRQPKG